MTTTELGAGMVCPFCQYATPLATGINTTDTPAEGDVTMCISCGRFAIFTVTALGLVARRPTYEERQAINSDRAARRVHRAWLEACWRGTDE